MAVEHLDLLVGGEGGGEEGEVRGGGEGGGEIGQ